MNQIYEHALRIVSTQFSRVRGGREVENISWFD